MSKQIELVSGINPAIYLINQACGINKKLGILEEKSHRFVADAFVFSQNNGVIERIEFSDIDETHLIEKDFRNLPCSVIETSQNFGAIIGHVLASGEDCDGAMQNAINIATKVNLLSQASV